MRRNTLPIKSSSNRKPQTTNPSISAHLARMSAMMNAPSRKPQPSISTRSQDKSSSNVLNRMISNDDSDDYYDDYIMSENDEDSHSDSDGQFVTATLAKYNRQRGATLAEILMLQKNVMHTKVEGVCSICLEEWKAKDEFLVLPCVHKFHEGCIKDWLQKKNKCPCCNSVVFQEEPE